VLLKNMSVVGVLRGGWVQSHPEYPAAAHAALMELFGAGKIRPWSVTYKLTTFRGNAESMIESDGEGGGKS
jgi:hypothetical protein